MWVNTFGLKLCAIVKNVLILGEKGENHIEATSGLRLS